MTDGKKYVINKFDIDAFYRDLADYLVENITYLETTKDIGYSNYIITCYDNNTMDKLREYSDLFNYLNHKCERYIGEYVALYSVDCISIMISMNAYSDWDVLARTFGENITSVYQIAQNILMYDLIIDNGITEVIKYMVKKWNKGENENDTVK